MRTLKTLARDARELARYVKMELPKEVSQTWLWTTQNAFLTGTDPTDGRKWVDRFGLVRDKHGQFFGNVEPFLNYSKLKRTGRLLRSIKSRYTRFSFSGCKIVLRSTSPYAKVHNEGGEGKIKTIKPPHSSVDTVVITGANIVARPFMFPSKQILESPKSFLTHKMRSLGW